MHEITNPDDALRAHGLRGRARRPEDNMSQFVHESDAHSPALAALIRRIHRDRLTPAPAPLGWRDLAIGVAALGCVLLFAALKRTDA
jgi:hypothetical protein